jgi:hypothetical protein
MRITVRKRNYDDTDGDLEEWSTDELSYVIMEPGFYCRVYRNDGAIGTIDNDTLFDVERIRPEVLDESCQEHLKSMEDFNRSLSKA